MRFNGCAREEIEGRKWNKREELIYISGGSCHKYHFCCNKTKHQSMCKLKKVSAAFFSWPEDHKFMERKKMTWHIYIYGMSKKFLSVARYTDYGPSEMPLSLKLALLTSQILCHSLPVIPLWRKYSPEIKQPRDLHWVKVKGVNDPAWTTQWQWAQWEGWSHSRASSTSQMGLFECCYNYLSNTAGASFMGLVKNCMTSSHIGYSAIYNVIEIIIVYHHELECFVKRMAAVKSVINFVA